MESTLVDWKRHNLLRICVLSGVILLLAACQQAPTAPPTLVPAAEFSALAEDGGGTAAPTDVPVFDEAVLTPISVDAPTPEGEGIRPSAAEQKYVPDAGPAPPAGWRPPPYEAPLSFHPDDHYWLARPLPAASRTYGLEWYPFGNDVLKGPPYRIHHGEDFPNEKGTPVLAAGSGTVIHAGPLPSPRNGVNYYGNTVVIEHDWQLNGEPVFTLYAHTLELFVEVGDHVEQGQVIAGVGSSGEVTGSHLHFEVRVGVNKYGAARNPALWLAPYEGYGTVAGRFVDKRSRMISSALLTLIPAASDQPIRQQRTYYPTVASDPVWRENFAFGDVPAGEYELILDVNNGQYKFKREIEALPGQTRFEVISTNFEFAPTPTAVPSPTPAGTPLPTFPAPDG